MSLRCLGVLLCYNDGDLLEESISHLLDQGDLVVWDHGSSDETPPCWALSEPGREARVPREFDFTSFQAMSAT
jgi:hypothetical protein